MLLYSSKKIFYLFFVEKNFRVSMYTFNTINYSRFQFCKFRTNKHREI